MHNFHLPTNPLITMDFYFHEVDKSILVLSADGGLNRQNAAEFVQQLESLIDAGLKQIIVDCGKLSFISSYGIGVLMRLHNKLARIGGDVKLAAPQSRVLRVLAIARMSGVFQIYPDVNRARLAFRQANAAGGG